MITNIYVFLLAAIGLLGGDLALSEFTVGVILKGLAEILAKRLF
jgi:hypothetical protein